MARLFMTWLTASNGMPGGTRSWRRLRPTVVSTSDRRSPSSPVSRTRTRTRACRSTVPLSNARWTSAESEKTEPVPFASAESRVR